MATGVRSRFSERRCAVTMISPAWFGAVVPPTVPAPCEVVGACGDAAACTGVGGLGVGGVCPGPVALPWVVTTCPEAGCAATAISMAVDTRTNDRIPSLPDYISYLPLLAVVGLFDTLSKAVQRSDIPRWCAARNAWVNGSSKAVNVVIEKRRNA